MVGLTDTAGVGMAAGEAQAWHDGCADMARALAKRLLHGYHGLGAGIALLLDGEPILAEGVGWREPQRTSEVRPDDEFHLFSIGKTFIAAATVRLAEGGTLDLDAPVALLLPDLALPPCVTIRRLLNHTAGVPDYGGLADYHEAVRHTPDRPWSTQNFLAATLGRQLFSPVGVFAYSNVGYLLVRLAIERATRRDLGAVLDAEVFAPLGASGLRLATGLGDVSGLAPGWGTVLGDASATEKVSRNYHPGWVSHGAVVGRALGAALALDRLMTGRLAGPTPLDAMLDAVPVEGKHWLFHSPGYGLGLMTDLSRTRGRFLVGHGGEGPGYSTGALCLVRDGAPRVTAVALANTETHDLGMRLA
jgi:D-alanyl-D-alanine carboxypeptidase